jgi:hypothetical protein
MELEGSLPYSQEPSTVLYPESDQSSPYDTILSLKDTFQYCPLTYVLVFLVVSFLLSFPPVSYTHSSSPIRAKWASHPILLDLIILELLGFWTFSIIRYSRK